MLSVIKTNISFLPKNNTVTSVFILLIEISEDELHTEYKMVYLLIHVYILNKSIV